MHYQVTDEIQALRLSIQVARERGWGWRSPYWICLEEGVWKVQAENESVIQIDAATGKVLI